VCLLLCLLHSLPAPVSAQSGSMPAWVVPVLRLVSATHVEPTTGIVLSADGLVLVPADFAAPGDEIIVLDGGTDIIRNGRPARLEAGFPEFGLEVLVVEGLRRDGAPVAPGGLTDGSRITLRAFPPAEQIAEGAAPVNATTAISSFPESETPVLSAGSSLPNVTGALMDECGNLAGVSLAGGVQSLAPAPDTHYRWAPALRTILAQLQLPVTGRPCTDPADAGESSPAVEQVAEPEIKETPPEAAAPVDEQTPEELPAEEDGNIEPPVEELPPFEDDTVADEPLPAPLAEKPTAPLWPWLVGALLFLAGGVIVHRLRRGGAAPPAPPAPPATTDDAAAAAPAAARADSGSEPDSLAQVAGPAVRLVLRGQLADGQPFETAAEVSAHAINVDIGRGNVDLVIESRAISRRHARLIGSSDELTLTDLGSSNGSAINGVPCLEGEIMYLEPGDTVILGDARFTVAIEPVSSDGTAA